MPVQIEVSTAILQWIISCTQLDSISPTVANNLTKWFAGEKKPTFKQIEQASQATGIPLGYFFLQKPPVEDVPLLNYRTIDSTPFDHTSRDLITVIHDNERVQDWTREQQIANGATPLAYVGMLTENLDIAESTRLVRDYLNVSHKWYSAMRTADDSFRYLRNAMSSIGVIVMMSGIVGNNTHRPLNIKEFRAFAITDDLAPMIFINANDSMNGRLFSLLHEFVHICLGRNDLFNDRHNEKTVVRAIESFCNAVTAEVLVPIDSFVDEWDTTIGIADEIQKIEILARTFKCGTTVIARRALDCAYITKEQYYDVANRAILMYNNLREKDKENGTGGGDFYRTAASRIDKRFFAMLSASVAEGHTQYSDAFRLTNTNRITFYKLAQALFGGGVG